MLVFAEEYLQRVAQYTGLATRFRYDLLAVNGGVYLNWRSTGTTTRVAHSFGSCGMVFSETSSEEWNTHF
jgi:hypothetical protein